MGMVRSDRLGSAWSSFGRCLLLFVLLTASALASATTYSYDAYGRIRSVTNSTGASSRYVYDSLGNLVRVVSVPAGQLSIFAFSPAQGPVGTTVTIFGQGFSATPSANTVKFNGIVAAVV